MKYPLFFPCFLFMFTHLSSGISQPVFDWQGHRGCRGLMPENSIPAFLKALELGVPTIEMDVVISMDGQIVVSDDPWMSHLICSHPGGKAVTKAEEKTLNIYRMSYDQVQSYDCGKRLHPDFPDQQKVNTVKPTLKMVIRSVQRFATENKYAQPHYSIELKSSPSEYDSYIPQPDVFVELVINEIRRLNIEEHLTLQSTDVNILEELHKVENSHFKIGYIVEKGKKMSKNLSALTFRPDIYSPDYKLMTEASVNEAHEMGMKIVPWTVNDKADQDKLIKWGVDGIITDYPEHMLQGTGTMTQ
ncbi:MAG TPA: glycerophosphodiester phosphodiesterase family protein [Saprospiraceae bacterium]|nr:glycerophosphodiester phosphodiesterase family protein [Saprospiraceae bacterium]